MKKIVLIRHAESESNIGGVYEHQNVVKITENGKKQAESLPKKQFWLQVVLLKQQRVTDA